MQFAEESREREPREEIRDNTYEETNNIITTDEKRVEGRYKVYLPEGKVRRHFGRAGDLSLKCPEELPGSKRQPRVWNHTLAQR